MQLTLPKYPKCASVAQLAKINHIDHKNPTAWRRFTDSLRQLAEEKKIRCRPYHASGHSIPEFGGLL